MASRRRIFAGDIVSDEDGRMNLVVKCGLDEESNYNENHPNQPYLNRNELGLTFIPSDSAHIDNLRIVTVKSVELVDRLLQPGDVVKRSWSDAQSGTIKSVQVESTLEHVISGQVIEGVPSVVLEGALKVEVGDRVIHSDWLGVVEEIFEEAVIENPHDKTTWRAAELSGVFEPGRRAQDFIEANAGGVDRTGDICIEVIPSVLFIDWICLNQKLPSSVQSSKTRPKRLWTASDFHLLEQVTCDADHIPQVGAKVVFKSKEQMDKFGLKPTTHRDGALEIGAMVVRETKTLVQVLWMDGSLTKEKTIDIMPYPNIDEYDAWPGSHATWQNQHVVVQTVNADDRTAFILMLSSKDVTEVSLLELDPHGPNVGEAFGVNRGDLVLVASTSGNGCVPPRVPTMGEFEGIRDEQELRRIVTTLGMSNTSQFSQLLLPSKVGDCNWYGEVLDLRLDGLVEITLPSGRIIKEKLERIIRLNEEADQSYENSSQKSGSYRDGDEMDSEEGSWEHLTDSIEMENPFKARMEDEMSSDLEAMEVDDSSSLNTLISPKRPSYQSPNTSSSTPTPTTVSLSSHDTITPTPIRTVDLSLDDPQLPRFTILEQAPKDHHFINEPFLQKPSTAFFPRLQKEFKVLRSSLPSSILVRSYEDRSDLLRVLILGPESTPYSDAPHLIDFYLSSNFPYAPPQAFFHSWTSGMGRISPNLYEDGKVCLSILNTWTGDKSETWSHTKSSLLQALVSIQGLVLVKEPWYCEPAYEKLRGTAEAAVNSRQYSEKAFVLSRAFVLHALIHPVSSFESEIQHIYITRGLLQKVVTETRDLVEKSESNSDSLPTGLKSNLESPEQWREGWRGETKLSKGAVLPLKRTLLSLEKLLKEIS